MKNILRKFLPLVLSFAAILPATSANAAGDWRYFHPNQLVITENTPLFDGKPPGMGGTLTLTGAALAPQDVESIDLSDIGNQTYLKIHTWVGAKWIKIAESNTPVLMVKRWGTVSHTWIDMGDPTKPDPNINLN